MNKIPNNWRLEEIVSLSFIKNLSYKKQLEVVEKYTSYAEFTETGLRKQGEFFATNPKYLDEAKNQLELCKKDNINIVTFWDETYPSLLKEIAYPPVLLYVKGKLQAPTTYSIAVVGTRHCTTYGKLCTEKFISEFVSNKIIIISGLAYGIDSISHKEAIKNNGITYAVIASGIDKIQPEISKKLAEDIVATGGAIISEYRCGTTARPGYFPQRNRIISGIARATLIVESAKKGGSLITARFAQEQGREVFAIPGAISSEKSVGCNWLIHHNTAGIAVSPREMLLDLGFALPEINKTLVSSEIKFSSAEEEQIYLALSDEPQNVDLLLEKTNVEISELLVVLLELEFRGLVRQLPGKLYIRQ